MHEDSYNMHAHTPELSTEARVFWVYNDEAKLFDDDLVGKLGDGLDLSLIFVGIFSEILPKLTFHHSLRSFRQS